MLTVRLAAMFTVVALFASCGAGTGDKAATVEDARSEKGESGLAEAGDPVRGGRLVYGLEAESAGGFCLPEAQLAISGVMVRWAIYDSIAALNSDGEPVSFLMLNSSKAPFDDRNMRRAVAMGIDRELVNDLIADGFPTIADQPFPPGDPGYVEDPGLPEHDPEEAKKLVEAYVDGGGSASLTITAVQAGVALAEVVQGQLAEIGIEVQIQAVDQATLISSAIAGDFQIMDFRYYPGGEPDSHYVWWYSVDNPVNFARVNDPIIDKALDEGRAEPDPDKRRIIYEQISRQFAAEVWNIWLSYTVWAVALSPDVHGVLSTELPDDGASGSPAWPTATRSPACGGAADRSAQAKRHRSTDDRRRRRGAPVPPRLLGLTMS